MHMNRKKKLLTTVGKENMGVTSKTVPSSKRKSLGGFLPRCKHLQSGEHSRGWEQFN